MSTFVSFAHSSRDLTGYKTNAHAEQNEGLVWCTMKVWTAGEGSSSEVEWVISLASAETLATALEGAAMDLRCAADDARTYR